MIEFVSRCREPPRELCVDVVRLRAHRPKLRVQTRTRATFSRPPLCREGRRLYRKRTPGSPILAPSPTSLSSSRKGQTVVGRRVCPIATRRSSSCLSSIRSRCSIVLFGTPRARRDGLRDHKCFEPRRGRARTDNIGAEPYHSELGRRAKR